MKNIENELLKIKLHAVWNTSIKTNELRDKLTAINLIADGLLNAAETGSREAVSDSADGGRYVGLAQTSKDWAAAGEFITDGYGCFWKKCCAKCGLDTMYIVRPGTANCGACD